MQNNKNILMYVPCWLFWHMVRWVFYHVSHNSRSNVCLFAMCFNVLVQQKASRTQNDYRCVGVPSLVVTVCVSMHCLTCFDLCALHVQYLWCVVMCLCLSLRFLSSVRNTHKMTETCPILDEHNTCASQQCFPFGFLAEWIGRAIVEMETRIFATCHSGLSHSGLSHTCGKRCGTINCDWIGERQRGQLANRHRG